MPPKTTKKTKTEPTTPPPADDHAASPASGMGQSDWVTLSSAGELDWMACTLLHLVASTDITIEEACKLTIYDVEDSYTDRRLDCFRGPDGTVPISSDLWERLYHLAEEIDSRLSSGPFLNTSKPLFTLPFRIGPTCEDSRIPAGEPLVEGRIALPPDVARLIVGGAGRCAAGRAAVCCVRSGPLCDTWRPS